MGRFYQLESENLLFRSFFVDHAGLLVGKFYQLKFENFVLGTMISECSLAKLAERRSCCCSFSVLYCMTASGCVSHCVGIELGRSRLMTIRMATPSCNLPGRS